MRYVAGLAIILVLVSATQPATAQSATELEPVLRTTIDPPRVVVGQRATLRVEVLVPNYMTSPPVLPQFQVHNAVTLRLQPFNLNERRDDITYAGVRYEFAIYPQEPGSYVISDQAIALKYAAAPPQTREATLPVPRIDLEAFIPDAATQLVPFVAATRLTIAHSVQRSSDDLKVGSSLTRTVTIKAEGTPAMLLPPTPFPPVDGLTVYPAQPVLDDHIDSRTDVLSALRVDAATYMMEKPGDYLLPAITVQWWNVRTEKVETARLDTINLHVVDDPTAARARAEEKRSAWNSSSVARWITNHWLIALMIFLGGATLAWALPRVLRLADDWYRHRLDAYLASESWSFTRLMWVAQRHDASRTYSAILDWLARFRPIEPSHTLHALKAAANDPDLDREIGGIEAVLFGRPGGSLPWSTYALLRRLSATRRRLLRKASSTSATRPLLEQLNPAAADSLARHSYRPVARWGFQRRRMREKDTG